MNRAHRVPMPVVESSGRNWWLLSGVVIVLFAIAFVAGRYYVSACDTPKKGLMSYLFDMEMDACSKGTPEDIKREEDEEAKDRGNRPEVFHIADQKYTYEQAKCKCSSYGAKLATKSQMIDAYNEGADWNSYGWSEGGKAFYPVQSKSYYACLKESSDDSYCREPGVAGGVFPTGARFGANCFGVKPEGHISIEKPAEPPTDEELCALVNGKITRKIDDEITPFNTGEWSAYD